MDLKRLLTIHLQGFFYAFAGVNHFINPNFYYPIIPDYLPYHELINYGSGVLEIVFGLGLFFKQIRKYSALGIIILLIAFIPSHWYFIEVGSCIEETLCVPTWVSWLRLVVIHPLLLFWAWKARNQH